MEPHRDRPPDVEEERVPLFGSWGRIYWAVIVEALVVMALLALFSAWRY